MKKVQTNKTKKLTLGKMTVAKLEKIQIKDIVGGDATTINSTIVSKHPDCTVTDTFHTVPNFSN